jgi:hypothetical protein
MTAHRKFADGTDVPVTRTRAELEELLTRNGATATAVFNSADNAAVAFEMQGRRVLMRLPLPPRKDRQFTHAIFGARGEQERSPAAAQQAHDKACRQKWRALLLAVKAKLVSVAEGVETFEDAFMAHVVMPDGRTVADHVRPRIAMSYAQGTMVPLLPAPN